MCKINMSADLRRCRNVDCNYFNALWSNHIFDHFEFGILNAIASLKYPRARLNHNNAHNILIHNCLLLLFHFFGETRDELF
jgi:hypothetical protein